MMNVSAMFGLVTIACVLLAVVRPFWHFVPIVMAVGVSVELEGMLLSGQTGMAVVLTPIMLFAVYATIQIQILGVKLDWMRQDEKG